MKTIKSKFRNQAAQTGPRTLKSQKRAGVVAGTIPPPVQHRIKNKLALAPGAGSDSAAAPLRCATSPVNSSRHGIMVGGKPGSCPYPVRPLSCPAQYKASQAHSEAVFSEGAVLKVFAQVRLGKASVPVLLTAGGPVEEFFLQGRDGGVVKIKISATRGWN